MKQRALLIFGLLSAAVSALAAGSTQAPNGSYLLIADDDNHRVLRYETATGAFVDEFVPKHSGGLNQPQGMVFGPHDGNLYVGTGHFGGPGQLKGVLSFDGTASAFLNAFVGEDPVHRIHGVTFGLDGNVYVGDWFGPRTKDRPDGVGAEESSASTA